MEELNVTPTLATVFKPENVFVELGEEKYRLIFDMNSFCELEKIYDTVDHVLDMLFGSVAERIEPTIRYNGAEVLVEEITVDNVPLLTILTERIRSKRAPKHSDTLELVWAGMLHDNAIYDANDNLTGYKVSKKYVKDHITFRNYATINLCIARAILQDLAPGLGQGEAKNAEQTETETPSEEKE